MYLLDRANKVDEEVNTLRSYLIKNGQIQYVTSTFDRWNKHRVIMKGTTMTSGRVFFDDKILSCHDFQEFQKKQSELISKGCTTVAVAPVVEYERQVEATVRRAKHAMASSTLDYIIGLTLPVKLLRPSVLRTCQNLRIPFVRVVFESFQEIRHLPWTHVSQTLLTYPTVLIPVVRCSSLKLEVALTKEWLSQCSSFQIHAAHSFQPFERWTKPLLQKVGLYPQKGPLLNGSDADYLLFHDENKADCVSIDRKVATNEQNVYHEKEPVIVIVRGEIVKANDAFLLRPGYGRLIEILRPGKFLSISEASMNEQQQRQPSSS
jgi:hypothetical protein